MLPPHLLLLLRALEPKLHGDNILKSFLKLGFREPALKIAKRNSGQCAPRLRILYIAY